MRDVKLLRCQTGARIASRTIFLQAFYLHHIDYPRAFCHQTYIPPGATNLSDFL